MPTLLTTPKMHPALAARVEAAVGAGHSGARSRRLVSLVRLAVVAFVALVVYAVTSMIRAERRELEAARARVLDAVRAKSAALGPHDLTAMDRDRVWIASLAGPYEGDLVAGEMRDAKTFAATVSRPGVYVRGPVASLVTSAGLSEVAASSGKDPLLACLLDPPPSHTEKALLAKVRAVYGGEGAPTVSRFFALQQGMPFLLPAWEDRVRAAKEESEVEALGHELSRAPLGEAVRAAKAEILFVALDEAGGPGPTELDGDRAHDVRIAVVDLEAGKVLVRARRHVDPSWITEARRPQYAAGLDGCKAAMDVRDEVLGASVMDAGKGR